MSQIAGFVPEKKYFFAIVDQTAQLWLQHAFIFLLRSAALLFGKAASPR